MIPHTSSEGSDRRSMSDGLSEGSYSASVAEAYLRGAGLWTCTGAWPPPSPPASFPKFQMLPPEIRRQIWKLSPEPRIIDARLYDWNYRPLTSAPSDQRMLRRPDYPVRSPLPPTFYVCRESRDEVMKLYSELKPSSPSTLLYPVPGTKINFDIDVIFCGLGCGPRLFSRSWTHHAILFTPSAILRQLNLGHRDLGEEVIPEVTRLAITVHEICLVVPEFLGPYLKTEWDDIMEGLQKDYNLEALLLLDPETIQCPISQFKSYIEFVDPRVRKEKTAKQASSNISIHQMTEGLNIAKAAAGDRWKAPEITYYGSFRWMDGSKSMP